MFSKSAVLVFPKELVDQPVVSRVIRRFDVDVTILKATITPGADGRMLAVFSGEQEGVEHALDHLEQSHVRVMRPARTLVWDESLCVHCTACVGLCPSGALNVDGASYDVRYSESDCIGCELCVRACSYGALESIGDYLEPLNGGH